MEYILHLLVLVSLYLMLSCSLSIISGFAGMMSLAHAGFFGLGAYVAAICSIRYGFQFPLVLLIALPISGLVAIGFAVITMRTVDDYFLICTLGLQIILFSLMNNLVNLTQGPLGMSGIPFLAIGPLVVKSKWLFLSLTCGFAVGFWLLIKILPRIGFGRLLMAVSEDEIYVQSIGKSVWWTKVIAFATSGMLAAIPGVLYAYYISFIDPTSFTVNESIFILTILIVGGLRRPLGIFLAVLFFVFFPEILRFVGMPSNIAGNLRMIMYGLALVVVSCDPVEIIKRKLSKITS